MTLNPKYRESFDRPGKQARGSMQVERLSGCRLCCESGNIRAINTRIDFCSAEIEDRR